MPVPGAARPSPSPRAHSIWLVWLRCAALYQLVYRPESPRMARRSACMAGPRIHSHPLRSVSVCACERDALCAHAMSLPSVRSCIKSSPHAAAFRTPHGCTYSCRCLPLGSRYMHFGLPSGLASHGRVFNTALSKGGRSITFTQPRAYLAPGTLGALVSVGIHEGPWRGMRSSGRTCTAPLRRRHWLIRLCQRRDGSDLRAL